MMTYQQRAREIERRLAGRRLVYFGTRGTDARPLLEISNFEEIFSQIAPLEAVSIGETCLETLKGERVDLNCYSIDKDTSEAVHKISKGLLRAFSRPAAVVPYRPCAVLAAACFTRENLVNYMGVFHEKQACFEHKPWVETQLREAGVPVLPWSYFADDDLLLIREAAENGPLVLRANRSDGGAGLSLIHHPSQIEQDWPLHLDGFLAAAPFLEPSIPLNVNACVFPGGEVSLHSPSLQLIGIPLCTNRRFGYCGNDFAAVRYLDKSTLVSLEEITVTVGRWLLSEGYLGAFGIDAIVHNDTVYLVEVNPRFQGSSVLAAMSMRALERPDLFLDHIAAFLDLSPPEFFPLQEIARSQPELSHVVCHNVSRRPVYCISEELDTLPFRCDLRPRLGVMVNPEGILFDAVYTQAVSQTGLTLDAHVKNTLGRISYSQFSYDSPRSSDTFDGL